ncbi:MAG: GNAT family N-acetyltransferase [Acidobacteriota bacterium]
MSYSIVKYTPEYRDQVIALQGHLWSPDLAWNTAYFEWKYERCPYLDSPLIYLVLHEGKLVGMRGICGARWEMGETVDAFQALTAADLVIAPDHRNRGLFPMIMQAALEDLDRMGYRHLLNLSASPVTFVASLATGWRSTGSLQGMSRRSRPTVWQKLEHRLSKTPFLWRYQSRVSQMRSQRMLCALDRITPKRPAGRVIVESSARPEAMAELVQRIGGDGRIRHVRDAQYLAWRYKNPSCRYRFLFWYDTGLEGFLVLEQPASVYAKRRRISIVDWEGTNQEVRSDLLRVVLAEASLEELFVWGGAFSGPQRDLLTQTGFAPAFEPGRMSRHRPCVLVRCVRDEDLNKEWRVGGLPLADLSSWDLRQLYSL